MTNSAKRRKRRKPKDSRRAKLIQRIFVIIATKHYPKEIKKEFIVVVVQSDSLSENDLVQLVVDKQHHSKQ